MDRHRVHPIKDGAVQVVPEERILQMTRHGFMVLRVILCEHVFEEVRGLRRDGRVRTEFPLEVSEVDARSAYDNLVRHILPVRNRVGGQGRQVAIGERRPTVVGRTVEELKTG